MVAGICLLVSTVDQMCSLQLTSPISCPATVSRRSTVTKAPAEIQKTFFNHPGVDVLQEPGERHEQAYFFPKLSNADVY
jgi:hypothetical protein